MKNCMTFRENSGFESDIKLLQTLSPVPLDLKRRSDSFPIRHIRSKVTYKLQNISNSFAIETITEFLKNRISITDKKQTPSWNDSVWKEKAIVLLEDTQVVNLIVFVPKFQVFVSVRKNFTDKNSTIAHSKPQQWTAIISETIRCILNSPIPEVSLQALCHSMFRLHVNSNDSLFSPVGIGKPLGIKRSVPEGTGKGAVAESIGLMLVVLGWSKEEPAQSIEIFDGNTQKWSFYQRQTPYMRAYHGLALLGSRLYVIGGFNGHVCLPTTICLDVRSREWSRKSRMSMPRCYVFTAVCRGDIYAIGGHNGERRLKTCEKYDPERNKWSRICDMMYRRSDAGGAELNGKIIVSGGFDGFSFHSSTEIYDPATDQWTLVGRLLHPRSGHCMVNFDGQIFALGGFDGYERLREVEKLNEENYEWEHFTPMLEGRSNFCTAVFQEEIYVMGGYDGSKTMTSVEKFGKTFMEWQRAPSLNLHRSAAGACVLRNAGTVTACELNEFVPVVPTNTEESSP